MIELSVIFGLYVLVSGAYLVYVERNARRERERLEDRVMALSKPDALVLHKAVDEPEPANVSYVDERAERRLGNGNIDLLGDDED
jgi:hypothetical protein